MKGFSTLLILGVIAGAAVAGAADAQTKYVRYEQAGDISWGELDGTTIRQLSDAPYLGGTRTGRTVSQSAVTMKAPVDPTLVFMTAFNFRSHISGEPAEYPGLFTVPASSIIGSGENIVRPAESRNLHYEAEMVIVIGKRAMNVSAEEAPDYIFGVAAGNDVSERDWQGGDIQWVRAKGSRTFNAVGPVLVAGLDYTNLQIEGRLNGEKRQGENSSDLIFDINHMVSYISTYFTLEPGDLIWSGTMGSTRAMEPGDVYEVEIEGVGILRNQVVQGH
jgi:2-keto-4-pentenoate hydratase/2-oxohepta-3-ene-1,7-dioic acid hydratase in catechol pathway